MLGCSFDFAGRPPPHAPFPSAQDRLRRQPFRPRRDGARTRADRPPGCAWPTPCSSGADLSAPRAERLRLALESLGPIFVKFGQVLSTRRDLMPPDIADELARLQDRVPPFPIRIWRCRNIESAYGRPVDEVFAQFDPTPVACASIAQVHFAQLLHERPPRSRSRSCAPSMLPVIDARPGA